MKTFYKYFFLGIVAIVALMLIYYVCVLFYFQHSTKLLHQRYQREKHTALSLAKQSQAFRPLPTYPKHKVIRILVISGGGIHGLVSLRILDYLSKLAHKPINQLFDVIAGTSVGAMQAAALNLPDTPGTPKHTPKTLLHLFETLGPKIFHVSLFRQFITGFGIYTPIINPQPYAKTLKQYFGHVQLSQLKNWVILFGYNIRQDKITVFDNHDTLHTHNNFLLNQLILGITAIPNIMPPQKITSLSHNTFYLADPTFIINNPSMATLILVNKAYPHNPKMIVYLSLGRKKRNRDHYIKSFYNGFIASPHNYRRMIWGTKNKLIRFYIQTLQSKADSFKLIPGKNLYINEPLTHPVESPINASAKNIAALNANADDIIKHNKQKLARLAKDLLAQQ